MKRLVLWSILAVAVTAVTPILRADVKTREKNMFKMEGMLGAFANRFSGGAADGIESTVALKGNRLATWTDTTGRIIDLGEEKVYEVDIKKKEYRVVTFAQMKAQMEKARADMEKNMKDMKPEERQQMQEAGQQLEFDVDVKETGQKKPIAGHDTRQVILTVTARAKGQTLDQGGGFVMTNDLWLANSLPVMNEVSEFYMKFFRAVYGEAIGFDQGQIAGMMAMFPAFATMAKRMQEEGAKLQGTPLMSTTTFEGVKSEEAMKQAQSQSGGGGISGALARRMMGNKGQVQKRTKAMTTAHEVLSIGTTVAAADVDMPAGFKEKK
ncbi:MAG TPA: hypothetical protein VFO19_17085 [Vicinamibacterales bacterium]|nr:hypothetical protein [Vicinamibacterales bacterium]